LFIQATDLPLKFAELETEINIVKEKKTDMKMWSKNQATLSEVQIIHRCLKLQAQNNSRKQEEIEKVTRSDVPNNTDIILSFFFK
jgi:hypothetical protein